MKLLIASDIHGDAVCLYKLLKIWHKEEFDKLILLGDFLYHGPRNNLPNGYEVKNVIEQLNAISDKIIAVKGNCDSEADQMVLNFDISSSEKSIFIDNKEFFLTHGHHYNEENLPFLQEGNILIHGHTHIARLSKENGLYIINPGSISLPKDNHHSYIIYENKKFVLLDIHSGEVLQEMEI